MKGSEFEKWNLANTEYMRELHLPDDLTLDQKEASFKKGVEEGMPGGLFDDENLLSRVALNSRGEDIGQVGAVFT